MAKDTKNKHTRVASLLLNVFQILLGIGGGVVCSVILTRSGVSDAMTGKAWIEALMLLAAIYLQMILHEGGHLLAGLASGYTFSSFRIGSLMLLKNDDGYCFKKMKLSGTAGQCLMAPPKMQADTYPFALYHLGGVLMNLLSAAVGVWLFFVLGNPYVRAFFLILALGGVLLAVLNGIPLRTKLITNDGYNALHLGKDPVAARSLWLQLKINTLQARGVRLREMDDAWFMLPQDADHSNTVTTAILVFDENRSMDRHDFETAQKQIDFLLSDKCALAGIYKNLLLLDRLYIRILHGEADLSVLSDKAMQSFLRSMKNFPSVIRTRYAAAVVENDASAQEKALADFAECKKNYPYEADLASEEELILLLKDSLHKT